MSSCIEFEKINVNEIYFANSVKSPYVITKNIITSQTGRILSVKTPLVNTYGIEDGKNHDNKFKVKLLLPDTVVVTKLEKKIDSFKKKMIDIDDKIIQTAISQKWIPDISDEELKKRYHPIFEKNGFIKASVPNMNGAWDKLILINGKEEILFPNAGLKTPPDIVSRKSKIICNLNITQVWLKNDMSSWGVSIKLVECIVINPVIKNVEKIKPFGLSEDDLKDIEEI
jgi:Uri superfamily endonuclease